MKALILIILVNILASPVWATQQEKCLQIYYDRSPQPDQYPFGKIYATFLRNLAAHFPHIEQRLIPVESYVKGQIEDCHASIYIASYFENDIPNEFLKDFAQTQKQVAWLGYSVWLYSVEQQKDLFGAHYTHLTSLEASKPDADGNPSFFREIHYKGEVFRKFGQWVQRGAELEFVGPFEMAAMQPESKNGVKAWAEQSNTGERLPYILNKDNHYYVADIPFSYAHESDRYLVFADLLFDILEESPRHKKRPALMRIEDVHPLTSIRELEQVKKVFLEEDVPLHIALIPVFYDPLYRYDRRPDQEFVPMTENSPFLHWVKTARDDGTVFIWHGVTHQYRKIANPHTGFSSDDFEFWDANHDQPIPEDSVDYVLNRLQFGFRFLQESGISPRVWLTPHYQASALDYQVFAKVFDWNVGRVIYFLGSSKGLPAWSEEKKEGLLFSNPDFNLVMDRQRKYFSNLHVETQGAWFGQLYPYEIFGDKYGQRLIPEILGNPQPFESDHVVWPRTVDEILADAKRNLVIRDCWASLFFHPYLLDSYLNDGIGQFDGDSRELQRLLKGLKKLGYKFVNLNQFIENNRSIKNVIVKEYP